MGRLINFLRGSVALTVTGPFPEGFLNLCAERRLVFWDVRKPEEGGIAVTVSRWDAARAEALGEEAGCAVRRTEARGLPAFLGRFRRRYALLVGMALSLAAVCVLSHFILWVEVAGNDTVPTAEIITELRRLGLRPGVYGGAVDEGALSRALLVKLDSLSWCAINLHGTRAEVLVREAVRPPELPEETAPGDVTARLPGLVEHLEVLEGAAAVTEGATVVAGDVLIAGNVQDPLPQYSELTPQRRQVRAAGRVYARTWRTLTAAIPLEVQVKRYTGEEAARWAVHFLGWRVNFYGNSGILPGRYDKMTDVWTARLPSGQALPLSVSRETARAWETEPGELDADAARAMLEERLLAALKARVGEGEVLSTACAAEVVDRTLVVTLTAECREEIGRFAPFP